MEAAPFSAHQTGLTATVTPQMGVKSTYKLSKTVERVVGPVRQANFATHPVRLQPARPAATRRCVGCLAWTPTTTFPTAVTAAAPANSREPLQYATTEIVRSENARQDSQTATDATAMDAKLT